MKKINNLFVLGLILVGLFVMTGCGKSNYDEYMGYQYTGKDPWENKLAITISKLEGDKLTWIFTDVIGEGEKSITLYNELKTKFKDGKTSFNIKGDAENNNSFDYSGTLEFKDGKVLVKYEKGQLTTNSSEGGSSSYNVGALDNSKKNITLTKVS